MCYGHAADSDCICPVGFSEADGGGRRLQRASARDDPDGSGRQRLALNARKQQRGAVWRASVHCFVTSADKLEIKAPLGTTRMAWRRRRGTIASLSHSSDLVHDGRGCGFMTRLRSGRLGWVGDDSDGSETTRMGRR
jgi:hypothetical protein